MKPAAFVNLPVNPCRLPVVALNAIHAEIVFACRRVFRINKWQGNKCPAVFLPRRQNRKLIEPRGTVNNFGDGRATAHVARAEAQSFERESAMPPQFVRLRRQQRFDGERNRVL